MARDAVLDASAFLAVLRNEPGAERVRQFMGCFKISAVNLSETVSKLIQVGMHPADAWKVVTGFGPTICAYDESTARAAIELAPLARTHGVSFADRACLVTAQLLGIPAVTADRKWSSLPLPCQVICIR